MTLELNRRELEGGLEIHDSEGAQLASLRLSEWESDFFGRQMGGLSLDFAKLSQDDDGALVRALELVTDRADELGFAQVQIHIDVTALPFVPTLEAAGFRLVDTRATFFSRVRPKEIAQLSPPFGTLEIAAPNDLEEIKALTSECFVHNPAFISRYKLRAWFTTDDTERWYAAWIENHFGDPSSLFGVWRVEEQLAGYYFYTRKGEREGLPFFKGMLTAVTKRFRGHRAHLFLQTFLYDQIGSDELWLDNTTQLTNIPSLHNHMTSSKKLQRIELTFFR